MRATEVERQITPRWPSLGWVAYSAINSRYFWPLVVIARPAVLISIKSIFWRYISKSRWRHALERPVLDARKVNEQSFFSDRWRSTWTSIALSPRGRTPRWSLSSNQCFLVKFFFFLDFKNIAMLFAIFCAPRALPRRTVAISSSTPSSNVLPSQTRETIWPSSL